MKFKSLIVVCGMGFAGLSFAAKGPISIDASVEKIFIPDGFDDNDNVEVVLHGEYPSTCYSQGQTNVNVDHENKVIKVKATSLFYPDTVCIQSITPYIQPVTVGVLQKGDYKVMYEADATVTRDMKVKERTTESPDDFLYAPVDNAFVEVDFSSGKQALKLQGNFPYMFIGCMVMKEVRTYQSPEDVLVVLPIAEVVDGPACDEQPDDRSYQITKGLSEPFYGEGLLHVRTLHGKSLNRFIDIQ